MKEGFLPNHIRHTRSQERLSWDFLTRSFILPGIEKHSGISHAVLHNCTVGDNVVIENVQNYIANYSISDDCFIQNVDVIMVDGFTRFGNGVEVCVE